MAKRMITVPAGFQTDLASMPRLPVVYMLTGDTALGRSRASLALQLGASVARSLMQCFMRPRKRAACRLGADG
jgi:hypothetical protein